MVARRKLERSGLAQKVVTQHVMKGNEIPLEPPRK